MHGKVFLGLCDRSHRSAPALSLVLLLVAFVFAAVGGLFLLQHASTDAVPLRVSAALVLIGAATFQARIAHLTRQPARGRELQISTLGAVRWLFVGIVLCYLGAMMFGPAPAVPYAFAAAVAVWHTAFLLPLVNDRLRATWTRATASRGSRRLGWTIFGTLLAIVVLELSLQTHCWLAGGRHGGTSATDSLAQLRRHDFQQQPRPGRFRVAALGGSITQSGTSQTNYLVQLERMVPGLDVYNFGRASAAVPTSAASAEDALVYHPDLVLLFLSVGEDLVAEARSPRWFELQSLRTWQLAERWFGGTAVDCGPDRAQHPQVEREYLQQCEQRMNLCRTSLNRDTQRRWQAALDEIDQVIQRCRQQQVLVGLVLVPGDFQLDAALCDAVRRRMGCKPGDLDLGLPQRRLVGFAEDRRLAVFDLLPHLQRAEESPLEPDNSQWNETGNTVVAQALAAWLQGRFGGLIAATAQANAR